MKAIIWNGETAALIDTRAPPALRPAYLLVRPIAVAINPTDAKTIAQGRAAPDGLLGCDFAGTVEAVGPQVTKLFRPGDRVCGCVHGGNGNNAEDGAWAELIEAKGDTCVRIPEQVSFEQAATLGASMLTAGQALFQGMGLAWPDERNGTADGGKYGRFLLVHGASTSAGTLAVQYARLAGYAVLATCSPKNFELVRSCGAEAVFDYADAECAAKIKKYTDGDLRLVLDTVGSELGISMCMDALADADRGLPHGSLRYGTLLLNKIPRKDVVCSDSVLMTAFGEPFDKFGNHFPAIEENWDFAKKFADLTETLLAEGRLKTHPVRIVPGGFAGILDGVKEMQLGKVSGEKLVCII